MARVTEAWACSSLGYMNGMCNVGVIGDKASIYRVEWNARLAGIGEVEWVFRTTFTVSDAEVASENVDLVFDGLDTFALVELVSVTTGNNILTYTRDMQNGQKILESVSRLVYLREVY